MNRNVLTRRALVGVAVAALALAGCSSDDGGDGNDNGSAHQSGGDTYANLSGSLTASGASFPDAFYQEAIAEFAALAPNVTVTYNATGSGTGKSEFGEGLTDFAGTDSLVGPDDGITDDFYYIPTVAAPITVSYNLPSVSRLQLSPDTLAAIFQRDITKWNDPAIVEENPDVELPDLEITVAHRSDGSGTTTNFTKYLEKASDVWRLGSGDTVDWPADTQGGERNTGVAQLIQQGEGTIGYVDLSDATELGLQFAAIQNKDGNYVLPTLEGTTAGLDGAEVADDLTYDPLDASGPDAYPITAPTYILVRANYPDPDTAELVKAFLTYLLTDAQELAPEIHFAPLPESLQERALAQLDKIQTS